MTERSASKDFTLATCPCEYIYGEREDLERRLWQHLSVRGLVLLRSNEAYLYQCTLQENILETLKENVLEYCKVEPGGCVDVFDGSFRAGERTIPVVMLLLNTRKTLGSNLIATHLFGAQFRKTYLHEDNLKGPMFLMARRQEDVSH